MGDPLNLTNTLVALRRLGAVDACAVTLRRGQSLSLLGSVGEHAGGCEAAAIRAGEGPGPIATSVVSVALGSVGDGHVLWPVWSDSARAAGFRAAVSVPAVVEPGAVVALTLYSSGDDPWSGPLLVEADAHAQAIARLLSLGSSLGSGQPIDASPAARADPAAPGADTPST